MSWLSCTVSWMSWLSCTVSSMSTLGVWIDDPQQLHPELVVDFYNLSRQETISRGSEEIRSGLMFTSNNFLKGTSER